MQEYFNKVYDETFDYVLRFVISKTDNISNVEDIMQGIYVKFFDVIKRRGITYVESPKAFLIRLARNKLFKYYSLKSKFNFIFNNEGDYIIDCVMSDENVEQIVIDSSDSSLVWSLIKEEDMLTQKIMTLYYLNELKISEISSVLNISLSNVKNRIFRTINKIKEMVN